MNGAKSHTMNCESCLGDESDREKIEIKEEKIHSSTTLDKMELIENDENSHLSQNEKDTETLESIQNYAQRIKSFLGWEPYREEQNELKIEAVKGSSSSNLSGSPGGSDCIDKENDFIKEEMDCLNVISKNEEVDEKVCENTLDCTKNGRNLNNILVDDSPDNIIINSDESMVESKGGDKNGQNLTPEKEIIKMDLENNNFILNLSDDKNEEEPNKCILTESVPSNFTCETADKNLNFEEVANVSSENELKNLTSTKEGKGDLDLSCISDSNTDYKKNPEESDSPCIPEVKNDVEKKTSDSAYEGTSDIDLSENKNKNNPSEMIFSYVSDPERDLCSREDETENNESQPTKMDPSESLTNDNPTRESENTDADDLRSEDSLDLDENFSSKNDLPKHYVNEIRRLSRDIVRDVIKSARNSVHELYASNSENLNIISQSEKLAKDNSEFYFNNGKQQEDDTSELYEKVFKENFDSNSYYEKGKMEQELDTGEEDTICGFGCFKPRWIQKYATPRAYLILFSIIGVIHGCYYPYVTSILSTLEKRYAFKTKVSGTILLADEVTPLILGVLVGYIGGKTHRPRMVALGMFLSSTCCFVSGLPYLIYGTSKHTSYFDDKGNLKFCKFGISSTQCNSDELPPTLSVVGIFLLASFLKGFATLSYYVIGFSYMDDIIKRKNSPVYFGKFLFFFS